MKDYVVDLEIAKKLKKNKFPQKSTWYWYKRKEINLQMTYHIIGNGDTKYNNRSYCFKSDNKDLLYSAPTSDEILKELPPIFGLYTLTIEKHFIFYRVMYIDESDGEIMGDSALFEDKKLSNALAKLWLYLKKDGYIK